MNQAETEVILKATKATYAVAGAKERTAGMLSDLGVGSLLEKPSRVSLVLYASRTAFRWDVVDEDMDALILSLVRLGANPLWMVDHRAQTYSALAAGGAAGKGAKATESGRESTPFGPALRLTTPVSSQAELRLWLLHAATFPSLASWWETFFRGIVPRRHHARLPLKYELGLPGGGEAVARVDLQSLEKVSAPRSFFHPPQAYTLRQREGGTQDVPLPEREALGDGGDLPRESAVAALLSSGASDEQVKLQMRNEMIERARRAVNDVSSRLDTFSGYGLKLDLIPLLDYLSQPGPDTADGAAAVADRLLLRALFWHWGSRLKKIFEKPRLREALLTLITAIDNGDAGAGSIEPDPPVSDEDGDLFREMRDLIVARSGTFLSLLKSIRDADVGPGEQIDALALSTWDVRGAEERVARAWFNHAFSNVSLQPEVGVTQKDGRNRGWLENKFIADGVGELIDVELTFNAIRLDIARQALLGRTQMIDDSDPRFGLIDRFEQDNNAQTLPPGLKKRAGFATSLRIDRLTVAGELSTTPTTGSLAVVALGYLQPQELLKLWNQVGATIELNGLSADVLVYFEQDRLSPAGPALEVWVGPVQVDSLNVSGWVLSPDPLNQLLGNLIVNLVLEEITPALVDRWRRRIAGGLDRLSKILRESPAGRFFGSQESEETPERERTLTETVQEATSRGFRLLEEIRLQDLLTLNREEEHLRLTRSVQQAQGRWDQAFQELDRLWQIHVRSVTLSMLPVPGPEGFNPRRMARPIHSTLGIEVPAEVLAAVQKTYDAWADQRRVVEALSPEVQGARQALTAFLDNWPQGQTACEVMGEPDGYRLGLAICRSGAGASGRALVYPPVGAAQSGDLTLLISARTFREMTMGTGFAYKGDVRKTDGAPAALPQLAPLDWWQDAAEPERLEPRPDNLREGPPDIVLDPSAIHEDDWRAYWSVIEVGGRSANLLPVHNPAPEEHVAEILVTARVMVGMTTYTPVTMERCGPDLTRLAGELEQPRLGDAGPFRPPMGPDEPRPRPAREVEIEVETGFRRAPHTLEPTIMTATMLENMRLRLVVGGDGALPDNLEGAHFYRPGFGGAFAGDADCEVVTAWDVKEREVWLRARLELRLPVFLGFGEYALNTSLLPESGAQRLKSRLERPILTYRYDPTPLEPSGPFSLEADGPLAGLAQGENPAWLQALLANHIRALVGNSVDGHRLREDNVLRYAYGIGDILTLNPENFAPYAILSMHPTHWSGDEPPPVTDRRPPYLALQTFGSNPGAPNLAINLFVTENVLDKLRA